MAVVFVAGAGAAAADDDDSCGFREDLFDAADDGVGGFPLTLALPIRPARLGSDRCSDERWGVGS